MIAAFLIEIQNEAGETSELVAKTLESDARAYVEAFNARRGFWRTVTGRAVYLGEYRRWRGR